MVANTRQVLYTATANEHDRVLLQVVAFAGDVGSDLEPVGESHARYFAKRRVGFFGRGSIDAGADSALLRIGLERGRFFLFLNVATTLTDQLIDCRH